MPRDSRSSTVVEWLPGALPRTGASDPLLLDPPAAHRAQVSPRQLNPPKPGKLRFPERFRHFPFGKLCCGHRPCPPQPRLSRKRPDILELRGAPGLAKARLAQAYLMQSYPVPQLARPPPPKGGFPPGCHPGTPWSWSSALICLQPAEGRPWGELSTVGREEQDWRGTPSQGQSHWRTPNSCRT